MIEIHAERNFDDDFKEVFNSISKAEVAIDKLWTQICTHQIKNSLKTTDMQTAKRTEDLRENCRQLLDDAERLVGDIVNIYKGLTTDEDEKESIRMLLELYKLLLESYHHLLPRYMDVCCYDYYVKPEG